MSIIINPVKLLKDLISCKSVSPENDGVSDIAEKALKDIGFKTYRLKFDNPKHPPADNIFATIGNKRPHFVFAGHMDVVPEGNIDFWDYPPFEATEDGKYLYGRGVVDMKGGIACMIAATARFLKNKDINDLPFSISFLLSGCEETDARNGTPAVLNWLEEKNYTLDHCIMGEPSSGEIIGDMIKIGRRGSISGKIIMNGISGHSAYPQNADNPITRLVDLSYQLTKSPLDEGTEEFEPTRLVITSFDVGNPAKNVIPEQAVCEFSCRFNPNFTPKSLEQLIRDKANEAIKDSKSSFELIIDEDPDNCFLTKKAILSDLTSKAVEKATGIKPVLGTAGGTSDSRYISKYCPVIDCGGVGKTMHSSNEKTLLSDVEKHVDIYFNILENYQKEVVMS